MVANGTEQGPRTDENGRPQFVKKKSLQRYSAVRQGGVWHSEQVEKWGRMQCASDRIIMWQTVVPTPSAFLIKLSGSEPLECLLGTRI